VGAEGGNSTHNINAGPVGRAFAFAQITSMPQTVAKPKTPQSAPDAAAPPFPNGSEWVRADFHLHTRADKEFAYAGGETEFVSGYVDCLKQRNIRLGVITNHNKFDVAEFKALRKRARKEGIGLLPGVELSVNDGANGVHMLIVFSEEWLAEGQDYINSFLGVARPIRARKRALQ
jgi:hypothetical protein